MYKKEELREEEVLEVENKEDGKVSTDLLLVLLTGIILMTLGLSLFSNFNIQL